MASTAHQQPGGGGGGASGRPPLIDPAALMAVRGLEFRARRIVEGLWSGFHRSPRHGFSVEFSEYRPYVPGDDPRFLDWKLFARSDRFYLKRFQDETNLRCILAVDNSRSMGFGSLAYDKAGYAKTLAATMAMFLHQQGDAVGLMLFDEEVREVLPARHKATHLRQLLIALEAPTGGGATDVAGPLKRLADLQRKRSLMVVLSDFLAPLAGVKEGLSLLMAAGHDIAVMQVLDPVELSLELGAAVRLRDLESGKELFVQPDLVRAEYVSRLGAHNQALKKLCIDNGILFQTVTTERPFELSLVEFLRQFQSRVVGRGRPA